MWSVSRLHARSILQAVFWSELWLSHEIHPEANGWISRQFNVDTRFVSLPSCQHWLQSFSLSQTGAHILSARWTCWVFRSRSQSAWEPSLISTRSLVWFFLFGLQQEHTVFPGDGVVRIQHVVSPRLVFNCSQVEKSSSFLFTWTSMISLRWLTTRTSMSFE